MKTCRKSIIGFPQSVTLNNYKFLPSGEVWDGETKIYG